MRISDWSSDVCSSDLRPHATGSAAGPAREVTPNIYAGHFRCVAPRSCFNGRVIRRQSEAERIHRQHAVGHAALDAAARLTGDACTQGHQQRQRSEEHTSELQSLMRNSYADFCLKKNNIHTTPYMNQLLT